MSEVEAKQCECEMKPLDLRCLGRYSHDEELHEKYQLGKVEEG